MFRTIRNILFLIIAAVSSVAFVLYLALLFINWNDESYSEDARYFLKIWSERQGDFNQNNAYVGIMGLDAAEPLTMWEAGQHVINDKRECAKTVSTLLMTNANAQRRFKNLVTGYTKNAIWLNLRVSFLLSVSATGCIVALNPNSWIQN